MAEAVFSISAEITPVVDDRELQKQAQNLSRQIGGFLEKELKPITPEFDKGFIRTIQDVAKQVPNLLGRAFDQVRGGVERFTRSARSGFLKFADFIKLTRRDVVGFGGSILDIVKRTNLFEKALDGVRATADIFDDIPKGFETLVAQVRSGTSVIDRLAESGSQLGQVFQPIQRISESSFTALAGIGDLLEGINRSIIALGTAGKDAGSNFGSLDRPLKNARQNLQSLGEFIAQDSDLFKTFQADLREATKTGDIVAALTTLKTATERVTGPLGFLGELFRIVDKEQRQTAQNMERQIKKQLLELDPSQLTGFERFTTRIRNFGDAVVALGKDLKVVQGNLARLIPGENIGVRLERGFQRASEAVRGFAIQSIAAFQEFRNEGASIPFALGRAISSANLAQSFIRTFNTARDSFNLFAAQVRAGARISFEQLRDTAVRIGPALRDAFTTGEQAFNKLSDAVTKKGLSKEVTSLADATRRLLGGAFLTATGTVDIFTQKLRDSGDFGRNLVAGATLVSATIGAAFTQIQSAVSKVSESIVSGFQKVLGADFGKIVRGGILAAAGAFDILAQKAGGTFDAIRNRLNDLLGNDFGKTFRGGILAAAGSFDILVQKVKEVSKNLFAGAKKGGASILEILGIRGNEKDAIAQAQGIAKNITGGFAGTIESQINRLQGVSGGANLLAGFGVNAAKEFSQVQGGAARMASETVKSTGIMSRAFSGLVKVVGGVGIALLNPLAGLGALRAAAQALAPVFQQVANFAKVAGLAIAGIGAVSLASGFQFNVLQQVINKTLPVLVGSKAAARGLLVEINALNDSSPFARQSFLELTRILAGFGVEASKITPLVDAIQQTVAATGGSEQDLLELGNAFARLASQGRLSGDIIQSFTSRGVDIIAILGKELGKTTTEIRRMISDGLIPADLAITTLTKGLKEQFDGATEAVAVNFPGALDRIKAQLRNFGGDLQKAFVNPVEGGALVDTLNNLSSALANIRKAVIPLVEGPLQQIANFMTFLSEKVLQFTESLNSTNLGEFASKISGLLPLLAGLLGFFPQILSFIPVIGPLLAGLGGPITAIAAALLTLEPVRTSIANLAKDLFGFGKSGDEAKNAITPFAELLPKLSSAFKAVSDAVGPFVGQLIEALGPILRELAKQVGDFLEKHLKPFAAAFGRLLEALSPVINLIKNVAIVAIQLLFARLGLLADILTVVANVLTAVFQELEPVIDAVSRFVEEVAKSEIISKIFDGIGAAFKGTVNTLLSGINLVIKGINFLARQANKLPGFLKPFGDIPELPELELKFESGGTNAALDETTKKMKEQKQAAIDLADVYEDNLKGALKAVELAEKAVGAATDSLSQTIGKVDQTLSPLFEAQRAFTASQQAITDARNNAAKAQQEANQIEKDRAKALRDVISPALELARAEKELYEIRKRITDNDRELVRLNEELADLRGEEAADDRAALDRAILRAKIALNRAKREENELDKEANKINSQGINLTGLSLDQVRSRLSNARLSLQAQRQATKESEEGAKSAEEIADEELSKKLDVADAEQALKDAIENRKNFEDEITEKIRLAEERIREINMEKPFLLEEQRLKLNEINDIRAGETERQRVILEFDKRIKDAKDAMARAAADVTAKVRESAIAEAALQLEAAKVRGDIEGQAAAQLKLLGLKRDGLKFDKETETAIQNQVNLINQGVNALREAQKLSQDAVAEQGRVIKAQKDELQKIFDESVGDQEKTAALLAADSLPNLLIDAANRALAADPNDVFAREMKDILLSLFAQRFSGFERGGVITGNGINDSFGQIIRVAEFGRPEAILPLTRPYDMMKVVNNPMVLPRILDALPRIDLSQFKAPEGQRSEPLPIISLPGKSSTTETIKTIDRASKPKPQVDRIERRAEQQELASYIGVAIKEAVKEALAESDSIGGADIDINVQPSSNNEVLIAREVRRQVEKILGRM